jgi:hypothetical protein
VCEGKTQQNKMVRIAEFFLVHADKLDLSFNPPYRPEAILQFVDILLKHVEHLFPSDDTELSTFDKSMIFHFQQIITSIQSISVDLEKFVYQKTKQQMDLEAPYSNCVTHLKSKLSHPIIQQWLILRFDYANIKKWELKLKYEKKNIIDTQNAILLYNICNDECSYLIKTIRFEQMVVSQKNQEDYINEIQNSFEYKEQKEREAITLDSALVHMQVDELIKIMKNDSDAAEDHKYCHSCKDKNGNRIKMTDMDKQIASGKDEAKTPFIQCPNCKTTKRA